MADPITCHVLDTVTGRPAQFLEVKLSNGKLSLMSVTDHDGRIKEWGHDGETTVRSTLEAIQGDSVWSIRFDVGAYYKTQNTKCFYPEVEIKFMVEKTVDHYHVPLLLSPWSYTTYRGS